jgi:hypothetical protein
MTPRLLVAHRARAGQGEILEVEGRHILLDVVDGGCAAGERLCDAGIHCTQERIGIDAPQRRARPLVQPSAQSPVDHRAVELALLKRARMVTNVSLRSTCLITANLARPPTGRRGSL